MERALIDGLRRIRDNARSAAEPDQVLPGDPPKTETQDALSPAEAPASPSAPLSPSRDALNSLWNIDDRTAIPESNPSWLKSVLGRIVRFALGPVIDKQVRMNSAQVQFDNEIIAYFDGRLDRMADHYDRILGTHGKRMEEIDERHLILQQELIRHVHDLVERIEFVFESKETNHLYVEGMIRETREELGRLQERLDALSSRDH